MWDILEKQENLEIMPKIVRFAETLPTSSAPLEQSFSIIKLLKTDIRNSLSEESLEGLILIGEEYREKKQVIVTEKLMSYYNEVKTNYYKKKNSCQTNEDNNMMIEIEAEAQGTLETEENLERTVEELSIQLEESFRIEEEPPSHKKEKFKKKSERKPPAIEDSEEPILAKKVKNK